MQAKVNVDPITLEVVCEGLRAIVKEMRASIIRASFSSAIYELDDFSCALFNANADMVAQSDDHPGHVMPMPWSVKCAMEDFAGNIAPGDVILLNDAYRGGTHLNDVTMLFPVFADDELFIFPAVRAHWADVGGMTPGSYSGLSTTIFQEGVRIPPIKLYEGGRLNEGVMKLLMSNMRLPEERHGDLNASLGACRVAKERIVRLLDKYGRDTVLACIAWNLDRSEQRIRERIRALPDGEYVYEDYLEYYDEGRLDPVLMRLRLVVDGDEITADFEGSNAQVPGVVNSSLAVAGAGVFVALKSTLDPHGPVNSGAFRAIRLRAPEASIVDVRPDAPAGAHGEVRKRAVSVMLGALAQVIPERVSGDLCGTSFPNSLGGYSSSRRRNYVYVEVPAGGNGGFLEHDGSSAFVNVDFGSIRSIHNVESLETEMPVFIERCVLRRDSGGEGMHRGGLGMHRELRLEEGEATYSVLGDRAVIPPFGIGGAGSAGPVRVAKRRNGEEIEFATPGKVTGHPVAEGDVVIMESAGGGGYGDPLLRDPDEVRADVLAGYVSVARASDGYGVVLDTALGVDLEATRARRAALRAARITLVVSDDERHAYTGGRGLRRIVRLAPGTAEAHGLAVDQLIELKGRHPAPLRAWVRLDGGIDQGQCPLDDFARRVLGVSAGDSVVLSKLSTVPVAAGLAERAPTAANRA
ncbi:MAG: hydantoinase B/oxoprolinase family protein [Gammaproteobacteria bacterium]|nr:hydantoinase B/oxoprolinase family protein [Gammaproteobacteria bacterium]